MVTGYYFLEGNTYFGGKIYYIRIKIRIKQAHTNYIKTLSFTEIFVKIAFCFENHTFQYKKKVWFALYAYISLYQGLLDFVKL